MRRIQRWLYLCLMGLYILSIPLMAEEDEKINGRDTLASSTSKVTDEEVWGLEKIERIHELLNRIRQGSEEEQKEARKALLQIGSPALPYVKEQIRQSEVGDLYDLIQQIQLLGKERDWAGDGKLFSDSKKNDQDTSKDDEDRQTSEEALNPKEQSKLHELLGARFQEAKALYHNQEYDQARRLVKSLMKVAPNHPRRAEMRSFLIQSKEKIVQNQVVRARIRVGRRWYEYGSGVNIELSIKNVSDKVVDIYFENPPKHLLNKELEKQVKENQKNSSGDESKQVITSDRMTKKGPVFLQSQITEWNMVGTSFIQNYSFEQKVPIHIRLAPGARWRSTKLLPLSRLDPKMVLRQYVTKGKVRPAFIVKGDEKYSRWIHFRPTVPYLVFPQGLFRFRPVTMEKIRSAVNARNWKSVFFMTFMLSKNKRKTCREYYQKMRSKLDNQNVKKMFRFLIDRISPEKP